MIFDSVIIICIKFFYQGTFSAEEIANNQLSIADNISVNQQYTYTNDMLGQVNGGPWYPGLGNAPHPIFGNNDGTGTVTQLNAITLGGFNGLNN